MKLYIIILLILSGCAGREPQTFRENMENVCFAIDLDFPVSRAELRAMINKNNEGGLYKICPEEATRERDDLLPEPLWSPE